MKKGFELMVFCVIVSIVTVNYSFGSMPVIPANSVIKQKTILKDVHQDVRSIALSQDGSLVAIGGRALDVKNDTDAEMISLWSTEVGSLIKKFIIRKTDFAVIRPDDSRTNYYIDTMAFSPDGKFLATGGSWGPIILWDVAKGSLAKVMGHDASEVGKGSGRLKGKSRSMSESESEVSSLAFSPDGKTLCSGGHENDKIILWDIETGKKLKTFTRDKSGTMFNVVYSTDGKKILAGIRSGNRPGIILCDVETGEITREIVSSDIGAVAFSPDNSLIVYGEGKKINYYDIQSEKVVRSFVTSDHRDNISAISMSPITSIFATGSSNIKIWDQASGSVIATVGDSSKKGLNSVILSSDGKTLVSVPVERHRGKSNDVEIGLWCIDKESLNAILAKNKVQLELAENTRIENERSEKEKKDAEENQLSKLMVKIEKMCHGKVLDISDFVQGNNPYADKGKCLLLLARNTQMTSEKTGLFDYGGNGQLVYVEFPKTFRGMALYGVTQIKGVYTYKTVTGNFNNVPRLKLLKELTPDEYSFLSQNVVKPNTH